MLYAELYLRREFGGEGAVYLFGKCAASLGNLPRVAYKMRQLCQCRIEEEKKKTIVQWEKRFVSLKSPCVICMQLYRDL